MKTPDYLTYDRYKKKKNANPNKRMFIFITTFFATLFIFTLLVKSISPNVDVTIGDDSETDAKESGLGVKKFIDERLKMIQMEDNGAGVSLNAHEPGSIWNNLQGNNSQDQSKTQNQQTATEEEKMNLPTKKSTDSGVDNSVPATPPRPKGSDLSKPFETPKMTKVFVGNYSSFEQAKVAQTILIDAGLNITPFVKNMGDYYTLQVGSYSSRGKAESVASELRQNNFPARVAQDQSQ